MNLCKMASKIGIVAVTGLFGIAAQAGAGNQLDFEGLKAKCLELSGNQQLKPFKAVVTCRDVQYVWREVPSKSQQPFQNSREVGASVRMKGFETPYQGAPVPLEPTQIKCIELVKYSLTVPAVDSELSCDDLNSISDLTSYCLDQVTQRTSEDPSLTIEEATGEHVSTCNSSVQESTQL